MFRGGRNWRILIYEKTLWLMMQSSLCDVKSDNRITDSLFVCMYDREKGGFLNGEDSLGKTPGRTESQEKLLVGNTISQIPVAMLAMEFQELFQKKRKGFPMFLVEPLSMITLPPIARERFHISVGKYTIYLLGFLITFYAILPPMDSTQGSYECFKEQK